MNRLLHTTLVLAAAAAFVEPATAQDKYSVLISPNVACRAAASSTAEVLGIFRHMGREGGMFFEIERTETSATGDVWVYLRLAYSKWAGARTGCWIPESVIAPANGYRYYSLSEANLLQMADGLLTGLEKPAVRDLVAVHNLLGLGWHREVVEESPILTQRRHQLLERALMEVTSQHMTADDPFVQAWVESLGDQAGKADGAPEPMGQAIVAPEVACLSTPAAVPSPDAPTLRLDYHFSSERPDTAVAGEVWTFVSDGCWVNKSLTAPGDTDEHLLAITDRLASADEPWSATNLMRAYNTLSSRNHGHRDMVEASPILSFRRLEVLAKWLQSLDPWWNPDPLAIAIIRTLDAEVIYFEPGGLWIVREEVFLNVYEQNRDTPAAHEILWEFVNLPIHHDGCLWHLPCAFRAEVMDRWARYWIDYPRGPHVAYAVSRARDKLVGFLESCTAMRTAKPRSRKEWWLENGLREDYGADLPADLRASLRQVEGTVKAPLLEALEALEVCAAEVGKQVQR